MVAIACQRTRWELEGIDEAFGDSFGDSFGDEVYPGATFDRDGWRADERWAAPVRTRTAPTTSRPGPLRQRQARARMVAQRAALRRSLIVGAFAVIVVACAVWAQAAAASGGAGRAGSGPLAVPGAGPTEAVSARVVIVQPGDTVWAIARRLQPAGDMRTVVDELDAQLHGHTLDVGQRLVLP